MRRPAWCLVIINAFWAAAGAAAENHSAAVVRLDTEIVFLIRQLDRDPHSFTAANELGSAWQSRGRLRGALGDYRRAEEAFRQSLVICSQPNTDAVVGLTAALASQHRFKEAESLLNARLSNGSDNPYVWAAAGDVAFELGDYDRASQYYARFAVAKPGLSSWSRLAKLHLVYGRFKEAHELWEKCCRLPVGSNPEPSAWAEVMFGDLYLRVGLVERARDRFERALAIFPGYPVALEHLAETFEIVGDLRAAEPLLDSSLATSLHHDLLFRRADLFESAGEWRAAARLRDSALALLEAELAAGDVGHRRVLARALLDLGQDLPRALALAQAELSERGDLGANSIMARALLGNHRVSEAVTHMRRALRLGSIEPDLYELASQIFQAAGLKQDALAAAKRLEEIKRQASLVVASAIPPGSRREFAGRATAHSLLHYDGAAGRGDNRQSDHEYYCSHGAPPWCVEGAEVQG